MGNQIGLLDANFVGNLNVATKKTIIATDDGDGDDGETSRL